ncbi:MAG: hypothetical protein WD294_14850, partial [Phycisphaeraceae bacterium]
PADAHRPAGHRSEPRDQMVWDMPVSWLAAASVSGVITALEILWIVFGALVLFSVFGPLQATPRVTWGG